MGGRVPRAASAEAARRAGDLYKAFGQPRRVVSSLIQLSMHRSAQGRNDLALAALDEAHGLIRPDWPAEFRIRLLRRDAQFARVAGRISGALALHREAVGVSASTGDWRLEVIARNNLVDLLWEIGPIEEAAGEAIELVSALRARPAADSDMDVVFANLIGILSEMGRLDEASAAAGEALAIMRRTRNLFIEEWVYLFWRRGQVDTAVLLLGVLDAKLARTSDALQPNEQRLIAVVRAALERTLDPDALARSLATGAGLVEGELPALLGSALAPSGRR
jgi:tetratricopeptide (TPR) repeat protein